MLGGGGSWTSTLANPFICPSPRFRRPTSGPQRCVSSRRLCAGVAVRPMIGSHAGQGAATSLTPRLLVVKPQDSRWAAPSHLALVQDVPAEESVERLIVERPAANEQFKPAGVGSRCATEHQTDFIGVEVLRYALSAEVMNLPPASRFEIQRSHVHLVDPRATGSGVDQKYDGYRRRRRKLCASQCGTAQLDDSKLKFYNGAGVGDWNLEASHSAKPRMKWVVCSLSLICFT